MIVYGRKMFCLQTKAFRGVLCRSSFVFPLLPPEQISICKEMHFSYYTEFSFRTNQKMENGNLLGMTTLVVWIMTFDICTQFWFWDTILFQGWLGVAAFTKKKTKEKRRRRLLSGDESLWKSKEKVEHGVVVGRQLCIVALKSTAYYKVCLPRRRSSCSTVQKVFSFSESSSTAQEKRPKKSAASSSQRLRARSKQYCYNTIINGSVLALLLYN